MAAIRYVDELIRHEPTVTGIRETTIADIGAGTGKLTVPLARLGLPVYAIEPNADMRAELADHGSIVPKSDALHAGIVASVYGLTFAQSAAGRPELRRLSDMG